MIDGREKMMLNLIAQSSREVVTEHTSVAKVLRRQNLVFVKVRAVGCVGTIGRQMIDLSIEHEAATEDGARYSGPDDSLPQWKGKEWPYVHDKYVPQPTQDMYNDSWSRQWCHRHGVVVRQLRIGLEVVQ